MKKLMIACAAALAAFAAAQAADVTSANIVGTQTITLHGKNNGSTGYTMIGINWDAIGGNSIALQSLFSEADLNRLNAQLPRDRGSADQLMIWNPTTDAYATYFLRKNASNVVQGWGDYNAANGALAQGVTIEKGSAMWYYRAVSDDITVNLAGEVADDATLSHAIVGKNNCSGYTMIAAGFPRAIKLNEIQFGWNTGTAALPRDRSNADQIMVWDSASNTYTTYFLRKNASNVVQGWGDYNASNGALVPGAEIPAGGAAWYYHPDTGNISISEATPLE